MHPVKRSTNHYVNNKELLAEIIKYKAECAELDAVGQQRNQIPRKVIDAIFKIANHVSLMGNFVNYSFREDMVSDAVENCIRYFDNFDPDKMISLGKTPNPFAYFTQITYFAFLRRIKKEHKEQLIKHRILEREFLGGFLTTDTIIDIEEPQIAIPIDPNTTQDQPKRKKQLKKHRNSSTIHEKARDKLHGKTAN